MTDTILTLNPSEFPQIPLFRSVSIFDVEDVILACPVRRATTGQNVLSPTHANDQLFVTLRGELTVHLRTPHTQAIAKLTRGDIFGELSVLDHKPASAFVTAQAPCRLLTIDRDALWELFQRSPHVANNMLQIVSKRIRDNNRTIESLQNPS